MFICKEILITIAYFIWPNIYFSSQFFWANLDSFSKYLLSTDYMPDPVLGTRNIVRYTVVVKNLCPVC